jgi:uroporphyrinogen III methyltransferase / synthase
VSASLTGKRVILTRAAEQSAEWARVLESRGAEVLLLPAVRIVPPETWSLLDRELLRLEEFDWVLFTSQNAVRFVSERLKNLSCALCCDGSSPRVAAVGQATADAARKAGWAVDCVAPSQTGEALAHELRESLAGRRILLPRSDRADDRLPIALEKNGAKVREAVAYLTLAPQSFDRALTDRLHRAEVDWIVFASPSAFHNLAHHMGAKELAALSARVHFLAIGPTTAQALREAGVQLELEATAPDAESVTDSLCEYYALRAGKIGAAAAPSQAAAPLENAKKMRHS